MRPENDLPSLEQLLAGYLELRTESARAGWLEAEEGEVLPHDAGSAPPIDHRLAWDEAVAALAHTPARQRPSPRLLDSAQMQEWRLLTTAQEPVTALPFCVGNFPQMVRNLQDLLQPHEEGQPAEPLPVPGLTRWAESVAGNGPSLALLAAGLLRLARQYERAGELLRRTRPVEHCWSAAWQNEEAALAWHAGRREEAGRLWDSSGDYLPAAFNRGLSALFLDRPAQARAALAPVVEKLPEDSSWHHLARLYLTLAEIRG